MSFLADGEPMATLREIIDYCDRRLETAEFDDYCPNGLQVEACSEVSRIVTGVTASLALIQAAVELGADLLLVHHGYFWKGEAQPLTGMKGRRVAALFRHGISLAAYHLPLDAHPELGNNAQLGRLLAVEDPRPLTADRLLWGGTLPAAVSLEALGARVQGFTAREPLLIAGGDHSVDRVAWCTGAAQGLIERAADLGFPAFLSGEVSEQTFHVARERGIHYLAAGHHATERHGVRALGEALAETFGVEHRFVDIPNPV